VTDHMVRIKFEHWQRLRTAAFYQCKPIKTLLNQILEGEIDPKTLEEIKGGK
jgi:hypothetical protein